MDYILKTINKKISRFEGKAEARIYHQVRVEYSFYLLLSYFWNKNFEEIGITDFVMQGDIIQEIQKPSIGTVASIIQKLDIHKELIKNVTPQVGLTEYAELRNDLIGHGYSFEDDLDKFTLAFDNWYKILLGLRLEILSRNLNIVVCEGYDDSKNEFIGTLYDSEGDIRSNWKCPKEVYEFEANNIYGTYEPNIYFRLSPFIHIDTQDDGLYVYRGVQQPLLGKIRYNRIDKSDNNYTKSWDEFELNASNGLLKKQPNGSIINVFTPNYKRYIEVGSIKEKVYNFLTGKEKGSSVCITLWGHGGNGKTATAQKICEELSFNPKKPFEFIIFLSAKDRELNKYTGKVISISSENRITSFDELIERLNVLIYSNASSDPSRIIKETSKLLLVIDDYETFEDQDKEKITLFIRQLNTVYHKVIITTRNSFLKIGDDIPTNELDEENTIKFLLEVLANEHGYSDSALNDIKHSISKDNNKERIRKLTLGKPIEIIRFINCFVQNGKLTNEFLSQMARVNSRSGRIEFLYGRNYNQLAGDKLAQDIFVVIGLLTPQDTLTSLLKHVKLILNKKDEDEAAFNASIDKLVKFSLIDVDEGGSYKVDSKDILEIMKQEYDKRDNNFKSGTKAIYDRIKSNITSDTDRALLNHVKSLRHQSNATTTTQQYREILKQGKDFSYNIKLEALLDLADFLFNHRGEKEEAVKLFDEFFDKFYEFEVLKRYAAYCWSINKEKTIKILEDFNSKHSSRKIALTNNQKTHLLGLILMRECFYWNDKYDKEYANRNKIKDEFNRIYKSYGHQLYAKLRPIENFSNNLTLEEINDVTLALEGLADISYRLRNKPFAIEICEFATLKFPERFSFRFKRKLEKLNGYRSAKKVTMPKDQLIEIQAPKIPIKEIEIINLELKENGYKGTVLKTHTGETKYGYIKVELATIEGRVYFRETSLKGLTFEKLKEGDEVNFGFGKINSNKFGAINVTHK